MVLELSARGRAAHPLGMAAVASFSTLKELYPSGPVQPADCESAKQKSMGPLAFGPQLLEPTGDKNSDLAEGAKLPWVTQLTFGFENGQILTMQPCLTFQECPQSPLIGRIEESAACLAVLVLRLAVSNADALRLRRDRYRRRPRPDAGDRPLAGPTIRIMGIMDLGLMILMVFVATSYRTSLKTHGYHHGDHGSEAQGHARHLQRQQGHGPIRSNGRASFFPGNGSPGQLHQFCASTSLPRPTILVGVDPGGLTHDWRFPDHGVSAPAFVG
jgi:hypothetical protein